MSTTRRAFIGEMWTYRARAMALGNVLGSATTGPPLVLHVTAERPRGRELAELVADHALGDEHRDVLATVVHGDRVPEHVGNHGRPTRPRLDDVLGPLGVL